VGVDAVFVGRHTSTWTAGAGEGGDLTSSRFPSRDQPALPRPVDRLDPPDHAGWASSGFRISLDRSRLLLGRHSDRIAHRVGNQTFRAKIGEGFWPLGFATAVLIKPIFGSRTHQLRSETWLPRSGLGSSNGRSNEIPPKTTSLGHIGESEIGILFTRIFGRHVDPSCDYRYPVYESRDRWS